jgi:phospholipid/cholesterol/gamma-HCH transport system substrate-binding protein
VKISNEFKVGVFGIVTLLVLIFGYGYLKGNRFFSSSNLFYVVYNKVDGLNVSNAVKVNGLTVGKVEKLDLIEGIEGKIIAEISVNNDINVPANSIFKIISADLLGAKMIRLEFGNDKTLAKDEDTMLGLNEEGLMENFAKQIEPIKIKATHAIMAIDTILQQLKAMVGDSKGSGMNATIADLQQTIKNLRTTTDNVDGLVKDERLRLDAILKNVESITLNLKNNNQTITNALLNIDKITDDIAKSELKQTIANTNKSIADLNGIITKIKSGQGSLGLLVNDDQLYNNLKTSSSNLDKLIIDLKSNPQKYIHFSIFHGKNK